uniref:Uncharacterized protein n=1 Tax=Amphimedon queenslandica TaxID=400682 RepID=A0A1X7T7Q8_AMPQE
VHVCHLQFLEYFLATNMSVN